LGATYPIALLVHSWARWAVLGLLVAVVIRAWRGRTGFGSWTPLDERLHVALVGVTDLQLLVGLWLYFGASRLFRRHDVDDRRRDLWRRHECRSVHAHRDTRPRPPLSGDR